LAVPLAHSAHELLPGDAAKVPGLHAWHADPSDEK